MPQRGPVPDGTSSSAGHHTLSPRPASGDAVRVQGVSKSFGAIRALDNLSLQIERGQIFGLLGPNGSGKTTLIRMLVGLVVPDLGTITVLGRPMPDLGVLSHIGYMTQQAALYPDLSIAENVRFFAALYGSSERVNETLETVGLADRRSSVVATLSGGMRTRVSLACALVHQPALLLLDEPTVGIDPVLRARLWSHFDLLARQGTTLVVSSHVMEEAGHCQRLGLLSAGALLAEGTASEIKDRAGVQTLEEAFLALAGSHE